MKKAFFSIFTLVLLLILGAYFYVSSIQPKYNGSLTLDGLNEEVVVNFDQYGVPHIYANSEVDAYHSLGYLQAQERLFQMEMIRRIATGTLSEVLGPDFVDTDKLFRTLSISQKTQEFYDKFQTTENEYKDAAEAYIAGINEYVKTGPTPIEFTAIGIPKTEFSIQDAYNAAGYMAFGFADGFKVDPLMTKMAILLGNEYLEDIGLNSHYDSTFIRSYINNESLELTALASTIDEAKLPLFHGSNSWIIGSEKSSSGFPIFENDTHIGFSQPSVWYEAHIEYPEVSIYGHYLAGFPFAILGHNKFAAWGMTMFENDDVDLFQEKLNKENTDQILRNGEWVNLTSRIERINIKDQEPVQIEIRSSDHGPIVSNILVSDSIIQDPVSVYWEFLHADNDILEPTYSLGLTSNISQAREAASSIAAPGLNIMYADRDGNIAWWAAARLPKRLPSSNSKLILDGTGKDDYLGYHPFSDNPQSENPPWGYVYSANNQPDTVNGNLFPGYYRPLDRASRISDRLIKREKWSIDDVKNFTSDVTSDIARITGHEIAQELIKLNSTEYQDFIDVLNSWDGDHQIDDIAPTVYYNLLSWTLFHAMADELGYNDFYTLANLEVMKRSYLMFIQNSGSLWWNDISTEEHESKSDIIRRAAESTRSTLQAVFNSDQPKDWVWGKIHTVNHGHPLGQINALKKYFDVGPFPVAGGNEVINNMMFKLDTTGYFPVYAGPSMRTVIDMGNIEGAESINPTGQSGRFLSPYYANQAEQYLNVNFRSQLMKKDQIDQSSKSTLILTPPM